jgi:hypothetical protein
MPIWVKNFAEEYFMGGKKLEKVIEEDLGLMKQ